MPNMDTNGEHPLGRIRTDGSSRSTPLGPVHRSAHAPAHAPGLVARDVLGPITADGRQGHALLSVDAYEYDDSFRLYADLPGMDPGDISVECDGVNITISCAPGASPCMPSGGRPVRLERAAPSRVYRSFHLPPGVASGSILADLDHGLLCVVLPKLHRTSLQPPHRIQVTSMGLSHRSIVQAAFDTVSAAGAAGAAAGCAAAAAAASAAAAAGGISTASSTHSTSRRVSAAGHSANLPPILSDSEFTSDSGAVLAATVGVSDSGSPILRGPSGSSSCPSISRLRSNTSAFPSGILAVDSEAADLVACVSGMAAAAQLAAASEAAQVMASAFADQAADQAATAADIAQEL